MAEQSSLGTNGGGNISSWDLLGESEILVFLLEERLVP